jgi:hypothetical protein
MRAEVKPDLTRTVGQMSRGFLEEDAEPHRMTPSKIGCTRTRLRGALLTQFGLLGALGEDATDAQANHSTHRTRRFAFWARMTG